MSHHDEDEYAVGVRLVGFHNGNVDDGNEESQETPAENDD